MPLITLQNVGYAVGGPPLLSMARLAIESRDRLCVVGRNGAGKTSLLRLLAGQLQPDEGRIVRQDGLRVSLLEQAVPVAEQGSVLDCVLSGAGDVGELLRRHHELAHSAQGAASAEMSSLHEAIDGAEGWGLEQRAEEVVTRLGLPADAPFASLSGGLKRRVLLARALVAKPDLLLLDEPTNHLDIDSIRWLEGFVRGFEGAVVFVSHDRAFIKAVAGGIVEIDRGQLSVWPGDWNNYLRRREERLQAEAGENARFDKRLAAEETWIRQGIKARRSRNEGRVRALQALRRERAERRELQGTMRIEQQAAANSGKRVIVAEQVGFAYPGSGDAPLIRDFSTVVERGDRIGLIGPNGSGKTTLLRLLLGEMEPDSGSVEQGTRLQTAFFDQHRSQLRDDWNAVDNVAGGREYIEINGRRVHALGYMQDFLFSPDRARAPITALSGGERSRLLLAKLFSQPSNLLVMDEPTNDLDMESLELLEEMLAGYSGTVLLVSHDRDFLDAVVTSSLVMLGEGRVGEFVGGYSDWSDNLPSATEPAAAGKSRARPGASKPAAAQRRLGYREQRELDALPGKIDTLEARMASLGKALADPAFFQRDAEAAADASRELASLQQDLDVLYARWEQLDA